QLGRAEVHRRDRRLVRRRELRHERTRLRSAISLDVAERADLSDGRDAGGVCADDRQARSAGAWGEEAVGRRGNDHQPAQPGQIRARRVPLLLHRSLVGRWDPGSSGDQACVGRRPVGRAERAFAGTKVRRLSHVAAAMPYEFLSTRRDGFVEYLTLNRPEVRNALNDRVIAELTDWAGHLIDASPRVVVIGGAGTAFCAGADATWMAQTVGYSEADNLRDATA